MCGPRLCPLRLSPSAVPLFSNCSPPFESLFRYVQLFPPPFIICSVPSVSLHFVRSSRLLVTLASAIFNVCSPLFPRSCCPLLLLSPHSPTALHPFNVCSVMCHSSLHLLTSVPFSRSRCTSSPPFNVCPLPLPSAIFNVCSSLVLSFPSFCHSPPPLYPLLLSSSTLLTIGPVCATIPPPFNICSALSVSLHVFPPPFCRSPCTSSLRHF